MDQVFRETAVEWAKLARTVHQRARRIGHVIRFTRFARLEDPRHEMPVAIFGSEKGPRPVPYIMSSQEIQQLVQAAFQLGCHSLRQHTYGTFFSLLACTGLRTSEAIHLRYQDITVDRLVIRNTKFRKSRLVPIHETARAGLERYLEQRRPYAPSDDQADKLQVDYGSLQVSLESERVRREQAEKLAVVSAAQRDSLAERLAEEKARSELLAGQGDKLNKELTSAAVRFEAAHARVEGAEQQLNAAKDRATRAQQATTTAQEVAAELRGQLSEVRKQLAAASEKAAGGKDG